MSDNVIVIVEKEGHWYAQFIGNHRETILRHFGKDTIPTAYNTSTPKDDVIARMKLSNRFCTVQ